MRKAMRRRKLWKMDLVLVGLVAAIGGAALYASTAVSQPPPLASEEMLRLVLPLDESGRRPGVLAWARIDGLSVRDGMLIGVAQSLALVPGVSRSGATMTAGLLLGLLAAGETRERILQAYPYLEPEDIDAVLAYAAWRLGEREESLVLG